MTDAEKLAALPEPTRKQLSRLIWASYEIAEAAYPNYGQNEGHRTGKPGTRRPPGNPDAARVLTGLDKRLGKFADSVFRDCANLHGRIGRERQNMDAASQIERLNRQHRAVKLAMRHQIIVATASGASG